MIEIRKMTNWGFRILWLVLFPVLLTALAVSSCNKTSSDSNNSGDSCDSDWDYPDDSAPSRRIVRGVGYVRARRVAFLHNKYAGYVTKIGVYSRRVAKKGDMIVQYDDLQYRTQLAKAENAVAEQKKAVEAKKLALRLKEMEPLPSDYRNVKWKHMAAVAKQKRLNHELEVYQRLYRGRSVSELALQEKINSSKSANSDVESYIHDLNVLNQGLPGLYLDIAANELESAQVKLASLERELALVKEDEQYYTIRAPFEGICILYHDTLGDFFSAGSAAEIHDCSRGKRVYAYFDERDIPYLVEDRVYRFRSNQYDCNKMGFPKVRVDWIKKSHSSYGDRSLYLVQCTVVEEPVELKIHSTGAIEVEVPPGK